MKRDIIKVIESRKGHLDDRVRRDYIRNGIATIPCQISSYSDLISPYSVKGHFETLNPDLIDYLKEAAELTPDECPLVLNIIGDCLSQEEKKSIEELIRDDAAYNLGMVEKEEKRHARVFSIMFIGLLIIVIILFLTRFLVDEVRELFFVLLYFMGDTLCDYLFLTGYDLRRDRRQAGRLASMKVVFSDEYEEPHYMDGDADRLYSEIEKDVMETIKEEVKGELK